MSFVIRKSILVWLILLAGCGIAMVWAFVNRSRLLESLPPIARDTLRGLWHGFSMERNVMITMPDGIRLSANIYFPKGEVDRRGTVLIRLPYGKSVYGEAYDSAEFFATRGFVAVVQDVRGRFDSEGIYAPNYLDDQDGAATIDWIVKQPWSNGKVGTFGCSALGESQIVLARARHPNHTAMISLADGGALGVIPGRLDPFGWYEGGIFNLASAFGWYMAYGEKEPKYSPPKGVDIDKAIWGLPTIELVRRYRSDLTDYDRFLSTSFTDPHWRDSGYIRPEDRFATPAMMVTTWQDQAVGDTLAIADLIKRNADTEVARAHNHVIVAAGNHCNFEANARDGRVGDLKLGAAAQQQYWDWYAQWFDYWLKDVGKLPDLPAYRLYVTGEDRWLDASAWPVPGTQTQRWFLQSNGSANTANGDGVLTLQKPQDAGADEFVYDPMNPVPTRGGPFCCTQNPKLRQGPVDQKEVESRQDVLVYSSPLLTEGLRVVGPLMAELFVSSSAVDSDLILKLVDVAPDGTALNIQEGALRLRYRDGYEQPALMSPGNVYRVAVDMRPVGHYFSPGHRIRLQVTSSNFPRLERNLNTGGRNFDETVPVVARNRILHGAVTPSALLLPVLAEPPLDRE